MHKKNITDNTIYIDGNTFVFDNHESMEKVKANIDGFVNDLYQVLNGAFISDKLKQRYDDKSLKVAQKEVAYCFLAVSEKKPQTPDDTVNCFLDMLKEKNDTTIAVGKCLCMSFRIKYPDLISKSTNERIERLDDKRQVKRKKKQSQPVKTFREYIKDADRTEEIIDKLHRLIGNKTNVNALEIIKKAIWIGWIDRPTYTSIKNEFHTINCSLQFMSKCINEPPPTHQGMINKIKREFEAA